MRLRQLDGEEALTRLLPNEVGYYPLFHHALRHAAARTDRVHDWEPLMPKAHTSRGVRAEPPTDPLLERLVDAFVDQAMFYTDVPDYRRNLSRIWLTPVLALLRQRPDLARAILDDAARAPDEAEVPR